MIKTFVGLLSIFALVGLTNVSCTSSSNKASVVDQKSVAANFKGLWMGTGQMESTVLGNAPCSKITIHLDFPTNQVAVTQFAETCGTQSVKLPDMNLDIIGNQVSYKGNVVGTISETQISGSTTDSNNRKFDFNLELQPDGRVNISEKAAQSGIQVLTINGVLESSGP